jgi:hypothetical protein
MMDLQDRQKLDELRAHVACPKSFICIHSALADLCRGDYQRDTDVLVCLETGAVPCPFAKPSEGALVCTCCVRKFIARNLDKWSADATGLLRQGQA